MAASFVQATAKFRAAGANSVTSATITTSSGGFGVVTVSSWHLSGCTHTVTDSKSNSWTNDKTDVGANGARVRATIASAQLSSFGSSHTATVTSSQTDSATYLACNFSELSGVATSTPVDVTATDPGAGGDASSTPTTGTTSQADTIAIACVTMSAPSTSVGISDPPSTGYTSIGAEQDSDTYVGYEAAYKVISSTGTQSASWNFGVTADEDAGILVVYKAAAGITLTQKGFRWATDTGAESSHTWDAAENTNLTAPDTQQKLLRVELEAGGDPASASYTIRYQKNGTGGYADVPVGSGTSPTIGTPTVGTLAYSTSGGTSVAPSYPASIAANDTLVLIVGQKPSSANGGTCTTPAGWTLVAQRTGATDGDTGGYTTTLGIDTGNTNIYVYTKDSVTGSETGTLSVTVGTNNVCWGAIVLIPKTDTGTWSIIADTGKDTSAGNVSIASSAGMAVTAGDMMIGAMCIPTDVTTPTQFSSEAMAQTSTTFGTMGELAEPDSTVGNDIGGFIFYQPVSSGGASGVVTMSATAGGTTTNVRGPGIILRARVTGVSNEVYISPSSAVTNGEATTNQLTGSSATFEASQRVDTQNGITHNFTSNYQTEMEWCIALSSTPVDTDYFDFRVYKGGSALDTYTNTARWTVGSGGTNINATREAYTYTEYAATTAWNKNVSATVEAYTYTEYAATVSFGTNIAATSETYTYTEYPTSVTYNVGISTTSETYTYTEYAATVNFGINIVATSEAYTYVEYAASITYDVSVNASSEAYTYTEYPSTISYDRNITTNSEAYTYTEYAATISTTSNVSINATTEAYTYTEYTVTVSYIPIDSGVRHGMLSAKHIRNKIRRRR